MSNTFFTVEDNQFIKVLATVPIDDLCRTLPATIIFLLRILSKKMKNTIDNMHLCINASLIITKALNNCQNNLKTNQNKLIIKKNINSFKNINYFHKIVKLSLSGCGFIMDLMLPLIKEIKTLKDLNLSNNYIGISQCTVSVVELVDQLKNIKLQKLNISNNYIGPKELDILAEILVNNTTLISLNLANNNIINKGIIYLVKVLSSMNNQVLQELIISNNCIGQEGAIEIAKVIPKCTSLTSLNLSSNCIGLEGFMCLSRVQSQNTTLTSLNLQNNNIRLFQEWDAI
jgi:Ran GTPase-activating protein (RanGAP) involved in mRNA processing and transport